MRLAHRDFKPMEVWMDTQNDSIVKNEEQSLAAACLEELSDEDLERVGGAAGDASQSAPTDYVASF